MSVYQKNYKKGNSKANNLFVSVLISIICGISMMLIFSVILSSLSLKLRNPINYAEIFSIISVVLGAVFCGIVSAESYKSNPLISSLISSSLLSGFLIISSLNTQKFSILNTIFFPLIIILISLFSTFLLKGATNSRKTKKYLR